MAAPGSPGWQKQLLRAIGAPATPENLLFVNDWQRAEGGTAANNPFNTTQPAPGASSYNSVGVRNYGNPQQGLQATVQTLRNGRYQPILDALHQGKSARAAALALAASPWGTGSLVLKMLGSAGGAPTGAAPMAQAAAPVPVSVSSSPPARDYFAPVRQALAQQPAVGGSLDRSGFYQTLGKAIRQRSAAQSQPQVKVQTGGSAKATGVPAPVAAAAVTGGSQIGQSIAKTALSQLGIPYQYGGQAKLGGRTDCSGLLQASASAHGISIPRTTYDQWKVGRPVGPGQLQPGDAVFFKGSDARGNLPGHVGIYIGGGRFVEDPHTGGTVSVSTLKGRSDYVGARRYY